MGDVASYLGLLQSTDVHMLAKIYAKAQGLSGIRYWPLVDFVRRVSVKGSLRVYETLFAKYVDRFFKPKQIALSLQMGDERVVSHMD